MGGTETGAMRAPFKIDRRTFRFSDGSRLAGRLNDPLDICVIPERDETDKTGMPVFHHPDYRHFDAVMFASPASVGITIASRRLPAGPRLVKRVRFGARTTVRGFLQGMLGLMQSYASAAECMQVYGKPKRHTYGCMLGDHVYFESITRQAKGRYMLDFGS